MGVTQAPWAPALGGAMCGFGALLAGLGPFLAGPRSKDASATHSAASPEAKPDLLQAALTRIGSIEERLRRMEERPHIDPRNDLVEITGEVGLLGGLLKDIAETVAAHDEALTAQQSMHETLAAHVDALKDDMRRERLRQDQLRHNQLGHDQLGQGQPEQDIWQHDRARHESGHASFSRTDDARYDELYVAEAAPPAPKPAIQSTPQPTSPPAHHPASAPISSPARAPMRPGVPTGAPRRMAGASTLAAAAPQAAPQRQPRPAHQPLTTRQPMPVAQPEPKAQPQVPPWRDLLPEPEPEPELRAEQHPVLMAQSAREAAIIAAIEEDRIELHLQPIVMLPQRRTKLYEALSRLRIDDETLLPAEFLPVAERHGLSAALDERIVRRTLQVARHLAKTGDASVSCNLAAASIAHPGFLPMVQRLIDGEPDGAGRLILEMTQQTLRMLDAERIAMLAGFAQRGVRLSMDGVRDLRLDPQALAERGVKYVKVPATMLLDENAAGAHIHPADLPILLGRAGVTLIAERVETEQHVADLLDYDVPLAQGFLFAMPRPVRTEVFSGPKTPPPTAAPKPLDAGPGEPRKPFRAFLRRAEP